MAALMFTCGVEWSRVCSSGSCCRRNLMPATTGMTIYGTLRKNDHLTPCSPVHRA